MSGDRIKKLMVLISLGILLCLLGCVGTGVVLKKVNENSTRLPIRSLTLTIDVSKREELFNQLRKFGEKYGFAFDINDYGTGGEDYLITLSRSDIFINTSISHHDPKMVPIGIYANFLGYPVNQEIIDEQFNDLKSYISEIPNVTITEERKSLILTIDESQREQLFTQMQKLADEHSLDFKLSFSPDNSVFHIDIHGDGFHITGDPVIGSPKEIDIAFLLDYSGVPISTSLETVDTLYNELKPLLSEIPNVTITEEK